MKWAEAFKLPGPMVHFDYHQFLSLKRLKICMWNEYYSTFDTMIILYQSKICWCYLCINYFNT